ncbi:MAG: hypothetical protein M1274_15710 [Actinobacteria bacterium]|nr:hypothetical protein [Actinomycetota bacterium]
MKETFKNALIRAVRTFFQAAVPVYLLGISGAESFNGLADSKLLTAAAIAGIIAALTFVMNVLEGATKATYSRG